MDEQDKRHELSARLARLSPAKQALLQARLRGEMTAALRDLNSPRAEHALSDKDSSPATRLRFVSENKSSEWSPLVAIQQGAKDKIILGVHSLSGTITDYVDLARSISEDHTFYALQARGIETDDEPHTHLETMAAYYLEAVRKVQPEGPYLLVGYSLGGHVAFEMAQQISAEGSKVELLVLLDTPRSAFNLDWDGEFDSALYWYWRNQKKRLNLSLEHLQSLDPDQQIDYLIEQFKLSDKQPPFMRRPNVNPHRILKVEKSNYQALYNYKHKPYPGRITLLRTGRDSLPTDTPDLGWGPLAAGGLDVYRLPGDHNTMWESPNIEAVGRILMECIAKAA
jgi:thioesterase domain-containing protein